MIEDKKRVLLVIIIFGLVSGFFAYKYFYQDEINFNEEIEEIALGDTGKCTKTGTVAYCERIACSSMSESNCKTNTACCSWVAATATPSVTCWKVESKQCKSVKVSGTTCTGIYYNSLSKCKEKLNCGSNQYINTSSNSCKDCADGYHSTSSTCEGAQAARCCVKNTATPWPCKSTQYLAGTTCYTCPSGWHLTSNHCTGRTDQCCARTTPSPSPKPCKPNQYYFRSACHTCEDGTVIAKPYCEGGVTVCCIKVTPSPTPNCFYRNQKDCETNEGGACERVNGCWQPKDTRTCCNKCGRNTSCQSNCNKNCGCPVGQGEKTISGMTICTKCDSGYYSPNGDKTCKKCNGTVSADGSECKNEKVCGKQEYYKDGKCVICKGNIYENTTTGLRTCDDQCKITLKLDKMTSPSSTTGASVNIGSWSSSNCPNSNIKINVSGGARLAQGINSSDSTTSGQIRVVINGTCADIKVTASAQGYGNNPSVSGTVRIATQWQPASDGNFSIHPKDKAGADASGDAEYTDTPCEKIEGASGSSYYHCSSYYKRGCASSHKVDLYDYCCVDNGILALSKNAFYVQGAKDKNCNNYYKKYGMPKANYTLLTGVKASACKGNGDVFDLCKSSSIAPAKVEESTNTCEDTVSMKIEDGVKCTNNEGNKTNSFYTIDCKKNVSTSFDYGNDSDTNTKRELYRGQGVAFGIKVVTKTNCSYRFDSDKWLKAYNNVLNKIGAVDSKLVDYIKNNDTKGWEKYITNTISKKKGVSDVSLLYEWWNIVEELKNMVKTYNNYETSKAYDESADVSVITKEDGKNVTTKYNFDTVVVSEGTIKKTNKVKKTLGVTGLSDPYSYDSSNNDNPRVIKLIPKSTCININTGEIVSPTKEGCPKGSVDGGNKMYISNDTDLTTENETYKIIINVNGLGTNGSSVSNNKCDFKVVDNGMIYRPIDVTNPFINDSWEIGANWKNKLYDFTKVIHANTWNEATENIIKITASDIIAIQKSNASNQSSSPYLGLCDRISASMQDAITKKICDAINK